MSNSKNSEKPQPQKRDKSKHWKVKQGTREWHDLRLGKLTASRIAGILPGKRVEYPVSRERYANALAHERMTGEKEEVFTTQAMKDGIERETPARQLYELERDVTVEQCGFFNHPTITMAGASPDGLLGEVGCLQIKCPTAKTHKQTLLEGRLPEKYRPQVQWEMECSHSQWCDFVSYHPDFDELFITREPRDEKYIEKLRREVVIFLDYVDLLVHQKQTKQRKK